MSFHKGRTLLSIIITLAVWVLVIAFFSYITHFNIKRLNTITAQKAEVEAKIDAEKKKTEELNSKSTYQETDEFIEKIAREQLGLVMPDEIIFIKK